MEVFAFPIGCVGDAIVNADRERHVVCVSNEEAVRAQCFEKIVGSLKIVWRYFASLMSRIPPPRLELAGMFGPVAVQVYDNAWIVTSAVVILPQAGACKTNKCSASTDPGTFPAQIVGPKVTSPFFLFFGSRAS